VNVAGVSLTVRIERCNILFIFFFLYWGRIGISWGFLMVTF